MSISIPPKDRVEWTKMITGEIEYKYKNYVLQTKIHQLRKYISYERITLEEAINELYELCSKYALAVQNDFIEIFKTW